MRLRCHLQLREAAEVLADGLEIRAVRTSLNVNEQVGAADLLPVGDAATEDVADLLLAQVTDAGFAADHEGHGHAAESQVLELAVLGHSRAIRQPGDATDGRVLRAHDS